MARYSNRSAATEQSRGDTVTRAAVWALRQVGSHVSPRRLNRMGAALGSVARSWVASRRRIVDANLRLCFPEMSASDRAKLQQRHFRELGKMGAEATSAWFAHDNDIDALDVRFEGLERLREIQSREQGILLISGHFTTMEMCARLLSKQIRFGALYRPHEQPAMEDSVVKARTKYINPLLQKSAVRAAIRLLRGSGVLWFAPDQHYKGVNSVIAPFMNVPAKTITTPAELARLTGAAVIGLVQHRDQRGRYHLKLTNPLPNFPTDDSVENAMRINALVEENVRLAPHQYLWTHRRFKPVSDDAPDPYLSD